VIVTFGDQATEDLFHGVASKAARSIPRELWRNAARKLDMLNAAQELADLRSPPANRLEKLQGDLAGFWSIRINDQFRIIFRFEAGTASDVRVIDYH
jgi:proteic killer suppression protein